MSDSVKLGKASDICCDVVHALEQLERKHVPDDNVTDGGNAFYILDAEAYDAILEDVKNVANITLDQTSEKGDADHG